MAKLLCAALLALATLLIVMMLSQAELLFPTHAVPPSGPLPASAERLELVTPGGERLHGVHIPPRAEADGPKTVILGFGGNAWNGQDVAEYLHQVYPETHVVTFHYRGYRPSGGSPSADALIEDAPLVYDHAVEHIGPEHIIGAGFSIGSGVAASLSRSRKLDGLILVTPFDSLKAVAAEMFPWLPIGPFFQHEIATADYLEGSIVPVAIIAGERDEIVATHRTDALRRRVPKLAYDRTVARAGHNDIYPRSDFQMAMDEALKALVSARK